MRSLSVILIALALVGPAAASDALRGAVDTPVDVTLGSGVCYEGATLLRVVGDGDDISKVRLRLAAGRLRTIDLADIRQIASDGAALYVNPGMADAGADGQPTPDRKPTREERRAAAQEADAKQAAAARRKWLAKLAANNVRAWPEVSDAEHEAAIARYKQTGAEAQRLLPALRLYETGRFLFYSNIPPEEVAPFIKRLDQMHDWMTDTYNLPRGERVWLGKAPVYAFLQQEQFAAFERRFFQHDPQPGTYGLCHQSSSGEVAITCYRGQEPHEFAAMLVHETSHGFIHRYKTMQPLPSWVNEGMADYIGALMVPQSQSVKRREERLLARLKQDPTIRRSFFGPGAIEFDDYGVASSLARFMIQTNPDAYVGFIEGMKAGLDWEASLRESYQAEPAQLVNAYAKWLGLGQLRVQ